MNAIKIACVGDVMCGDSFSQIGMGVASSINKYESNFLPSDIVDIFRNHDVVICNLECVLSDVGRKENSLRSLHMRGRARTAEYLSQWGITVANVANNHILEHGYQAAVDTVRQLNKAGVQTIGSGKNNDFQSGIDSVQMNIAGIELALFGVCLLREKYAFNGGGNLNEIIAEIQSCANNGKIVIVSVHWGDELIDRPGLAQREIAQQFINAGAKLIIGHHPHVVQGIVSSGTNLIAYSLGNFIFDSSSELTAWSIILSITIFPDGRISWSGIPLIRSQDHRPILAAGELRGSLQQEIQRRCDIALCVADKKYVEAYVNELHRLSIRSRRKLWRNIISRITRYKPVFLPQIALRPVQRRLGLW